MFLGGFGDCWDNSSLLSSLGTQWKKKEEEKKKDKKKDEDEKV